MTSLPTVPVHHLEIHPRDHELIAATHGRSIWVNDIAPLEQMADSSMSQRAHFFQPTTAYQYAQLNTQAWNGNKIYVADNPPYGATLAYRLTAGDSRRDTTRVVITNVKGDVVRTLTGAGGAGVHRVTWDLRGTPRPLGPAGIRDSINAARARRQREDSVRAAGRDTTAAGRNLPGMDTTARRGRGPGGAGQATGEINLRPAEAPPGPPQAGGGGGGGGRFGSGARNGPPVPPGDYLVTITANGMTMKRVVRVERIGDIPEDFGFGGEEEEGEEH